MAMKKLNCLLALLLIISIAACKKENRIRHGLSGLWEIEKSEVSTYVNGEVDHTVTLENLGTLELQDLPGTSPEYNNCYIGFTQGYWPLGFNQLNNTQTPQTRQCHWYGDLRARDRLTFWAQGGFALADQIFVIYTRIKNAHGPGNNEQWMYLDLDANGAIQTKEVLYVKLVDGSGNID